MLTTEGEGEIGQNSIFFCYWKNSFQVELDAIKKKKKIKGNIPFHLSFQQSYSLYHLYLQDMNLGMNVTLA